MDILNQQYMLTNGILKWVCALFCRMHTVVFWTMMMISPYLQFMTAMEVKTMSVLLLSVSFLEVFVPEVTFIKFQTTATIVDCT